jgi:hypothetical protein
MKQHITLKLGAILTLLIALTACGGPESQLVGVWKQQGEHANHYLDFRENGEGYWIFHRGPNIDTVPMKYVADFSATPFKLDLNGYGYGPFKDRGYYGIFEFEGDDGLKVLMTPGLPNQGGDSLRPKAMGQKAVSYKRNN